MPTPTTRSLVLVLLFAGLSAAAETPEANYQTKLAELQTKFEEQVRTAQEETLSKLDDLLKMETSRGDLDRVLIVKAERDSVANFRTPERGIVPAVVQTPRAFYESRLATARSTYDRAARAAHAQLLLDLDALVKEQTRSGKLDAAIATREQRKRIEKEVPGAPRMPTPPRSKEAVAVAPMPKFPLDPLPVIPATPAPKTPATTPTPVAIAPLPVEPVDLPRPPVLNPARVHLRESRG